MISLDIQTLSMVTMLFSLVFFIGMLTFARHNQRFIGLQYFAYGDLLLFLGFLLLAFRHIIPDYLSIVSANSMIAIAFCLFTMGSYNFLRKYNAFLWAHITAFIALVVSFSYFTVIEPDVNMRIIIISTFTAGETLIAAILFIRDGTKGHKKQKLSVAYGFILYTIYGIFRIVWTLMEVDIEDFLQAGIVHGLMILIIQILIINTSFSLIWIANTILNKDLEERAKLDPLTKILNRRAFVDELLKELARSKRQGLTFSLIMADIDHFKSINDTYGHLAGDSVLLGFTTFVQENLRIIDILARYGGEEFLILLPNTEKKQAVETAERIRKMLEYKKHLYNGQEISYTVSFGVTSFDIDAQNKEELLENADTALYAAKTKGRNRVESR